MFYDKKAKLLKNGKRVSDGMGGWLESKEPYELEEIKVASSPVTAELALREYGMVSKSLMKLYTEDIVPMTSFYINFEDKDYRVHQVANYGLEKIILMELM